PPPAPQLDVARIEANGRFSNLGGAVRASMDKSRNAEIAAIVILSDGRRNTGPQGAEVARLLNQRKVPHTFVLGIGDPAETQSVEVTRIEAPEKVFQKDPFELRANIAAQGYEPTSIDVKLVRIDDKGTEQVMRTLPLAIGGDKSTAVAEFKELSSDTTGRFTWRVELQPPSGEPPSPERHKKNVAIDVLGEKTRVLLLAGGASHEFQILRNLLIRDKTIDVSCWLQSADANFPQDGDVDVRIDKLPADRPQLDVYDAVVLMDPNPAQLTAPFCELLRKHVLEDGCGLWWVCGEKFTLDAVRPAAITRPIAELLPVVPDIERAERLIIGFGLAFPRAWPYALTPEGDDGLGAKITRIAENRDESRLLWGRLPGFHFAFPVQRPKPAATVLAEHTNPELKKDGHPMPLLVTQFVGAGRVLFSGTDETYRWRSLYEDAYNRYWVKGLRYLYEGRINAGNSRLRLLVGDEKVELGEAVKLTAEARNEVFQPLVVESIELSLEHEGHPAEVLKLLPLQQVPGSYELQYRPTATGFYRARATQAQGKEVDIGFQVVSAQIEREGPMDRAELAAMAAANGGQLLDTPSQLLAALDQIQSRSATDTFRTPHPMWDGWSTVVFMLTALGLEWLLRKRFNLL
ncbi:MAG TPA: hypothetical protein VK348_01510, partial [Planctomycetota bacterium]|nr:hypothetical protein [Planctomycetota bacterium]